MASDQEVEAGAIALFRFDYPEDKWGRFGQKDYHPEKYRAKARVALQAAAAIPQSGEAVAWVMVPREPTEAMWRAWYSEAEIVPEGTVLRHVEAYQAMLAAAPPAPVAIDEATHRHKARGTEYILLGIGKMQAEVWHHLLPGDGEITMKDLPSVDMREVAIYRSADDGSIWVRPREEFEDGRFEYLNPQPNGGA